MKNQLPIVEVRVRGPVEVRVIHEYPDPETRKKWEEYLRGDKRKRRARKDGDE
jgi:hypothetical protein